MIPDFIRRMHDPTWRDPQTREPEPPQDLPELTERTQRIVAELRDINAGLDKEWS